MTTKKPKKAAKKPSKVKAEAMTGISLTAALASEITELMNRRTAVIAFIAAFEVDQDQGLPYTLNGTNGTIATLTGPDAGAVREASIQTLRIRLNLIELGLTAKGVNLQPVQGK